MSESNRLTNQYTKEQIEEWASKRADDAGRLSRQLLDTMQREEKLREALEVIAKYDPTPNYQGAMAQQALSCEYRDNDAKP